MATDETVRDALSESLTKTVEKMNDLDRIPYDPGNDPSSETFVTANHADVQPAVKQLYLHEDRAWPELADPLDNLSKVKVYFARFRDEAGYRLTAVRKVSGMQLTLTNRKIAFLRGGALALDEVERFELHNRFDFLIDDEGLNILDVKRFEGVCLMQSLIRGAAQHNLEHLANSMDFVDFQTIQAHVERSVRSARALASIRANGHERAVDRSKLELKCQNAQIAFENVDGRMVINPESAERFLNIIARKVLESDISIDGIEVFSVSARQSLK